MKRTLVTILATMIVTLGLVALGAFVVAPRLSPTGAASSTVVDYVEGEETADYVEGYESDGTTRDSDYWQQQQLDEMRRQRQMQQYYLEQERQRQARRDSQEKVCQMTDYSLPSC